MSPQAQLAENQDRGAGGGVGLAPVGAKLILWFLFATEYTTGRRGQERPRPVRRDTGGRAPGYWFSAKVVAYRRRVEVHLVPSALWRPQL